LPYEVEYDREHRVMYIHLDRSRPFGYTRSLDLKRVIDYAEDGTPIGVELIGPERGVDLTGLPEPEALARLLDELRIKVLQP
jgi:hypothetical protein